MVSGVSNPILSSGFGWLVLQHQQLCTLQCDDRVGMAAVVYKLYLESIRRVLLDNRANLPAYKALPRQVLSQSDYIIELKTALHTFIVPLIYEARMETWN